MPWTCQPEPAAPLWWPLTAADHWYRPDTDPDRLAADFRRAHPRHHGPVVLTWWASWCAAGTQVRVEPPAEEHATGLAVAG